VERRISSTGSICILSIETPTLLENERRECLHFMAILQVLFTKSLHHKLFFCPSLQPKGKPADHNADKTAHLASLERRAEHPQQMPL